MTSTNIHDVHEIVPEVHHSSDGRGWLTLRVKRKNWYDGMDREEVEVTMFTEDIAKLSCDLSEQLRESIAQSLSTV
jgi:hypothetical protein